MIERFGPLLPVERFVAQLQGAVTNPSQQRLGLRSRQPGED
ncbi:unannotated protein [freshwater metagenome]|uniref:Unannotated protein n=1 Tax=freshwater metagenome TaxID=449393 RepID=A0A6J6NEB9_9ZZZZ